MQQKLSLKAFFRNALLFIIVSCLGFLFAMQIYNLQKIRLVITKGLTKQDATNIEKKIKGKSYVFLKMTPVDKLINKSLPSYEQITTRLIFPNMIEIVGNTSKPIAFIKTDVGYLAVSKTGFILFKERGTVIPKPFISFPQVLYHANYQQGQYVTLSVLLRTLKIIEKIQNEELQPVSVDIDSVDMIACKMKDIEVIFSQSRDINQQLHEFSQVYRSARSGILRFNKLDLRFDKPLLQFK